MKKMRLVVGCCVWVTMATIMFLLIDPQKHPDHLVGAYLLAVVGAVVTGTLSVAALFCLPV